MDASNKQLSKIPPKESRPVGRPKIPMEERLPKDWEDQLLAMCAQGYSNAEIKAAFCMQTGKFNHAIWEQLRLNDHEFQIALSKGKVLCQAWWESQARKNMFHSKLDVFENFTWLANMKNRFGWRDKMDVEHSGSVTWEGLISDITGAEARNTRQVSGVSNN